MRKRRHPLPRQTRGRELDVFVTYGTSEPTVPATAQAIEPEPSKPPYLLLRRILWVCVIILGLVLFGDLLIRFFREAPFAWPSINGRF